MAGAVPQPCAEMADPGVHRPCEMACGGRVIEQPWAWSPPGRGVGLGVESAWVWGRPGRGAGPGVEPAWRGVGLGVEQALAWSRPWRGAGLGVEPAWAWSRPGRGAGLGVEPPLDVEQPLASRRIHASPARVAPGTATVPSVTPALLYPLRVVAPGTATVPTRPGSCFTCIAREVRGRWKRMAKCASSRPHPSVAWWRGSSCCRRICLIARSRGASDQQRLLPLQSGGAAGARHPYPGRVIQGRMELPKRQIGAAQKAVGRNRRPTWRTASRRELPDTARRRQPEAPRMTARPGRG
jgi:hypothetical protein